MAVLKCISCNSPLTKDMIDSGMCFNCGEQISQDILTSNLGRAVFSQGAIENIVQYKIIDGNIYCGYCEGLLD